MNGTRARAEDTNDDRTWQLVGLATERGITSGSRVVDVLGAYPGVSINPEDEFSAPFFYVNDNLRGFVTGVDDDSTVTVILGGIGCSE